jgi:choline dehydrogenase-like flavoprotein
MFLDARTLPDATLEADVCIAGGGAAGMTLAMDLRKSGLSVILLESGGFRREAETQRLSDGRMTGIDTWNLRSMRIRALGGATGHWEGWCRPLMPYDFETRDYVPNSGWPISYADLLPWYRRACQTLEIGTFTWSAAARSKAMGTVLPPTGPSVEYRYYQFSPPTRFARTYGALLEKAADVRVIAQANLVDIRLDQTRSRVESFACRTLEKNDFRVSAGRFVLALGGIENARVLLASRSHQPEGVANGHGVVGRYFMEHPHYYASASAVHSAKLDLTFFRRRPSDLKRANGMPVPVMGAVALSADVLQRERLLNFAATFQAPGEKAETGELSADDVQAVVTRGRVPHQWSQFSIRAEQSPHADSRVTLADQLDPLGMPRVALDWRIAEDDHIQMHRALTRLAREFGSAGVARLWIPGDGTKFVWRPSPGGHHMGTTRMGLDPQSSVVNADCRTHEVDNLFIAGSSVFPTGGEANPTLTIVALAIRQADYIAEQMSRNVI